jgi:hypothetical protein
MNATRRAALSRAKSLIEQAQEIVHEASESERAYHENMPVSIQAGERGAKIDEVATGLAEAADELSESAAKVGELLRTIINLMKKTTVGQRSGTRKTYRLAREPKSFAIQHVRDVCRARDEEGLTFRQIGERVGISAPAAFFLYHRWHKWAAERRTSVWLPAAAA